MERKTQQPVRTGVPQFPGWARSERKRLKACDAQTHRHFTADKCVYTRMYVQPQVYRTMDPILKFLFSRYSLLGLLALPAPNTHTQLMLIKAIF